MHLKAVKINGFKSFGEEIYIEFNRGITSIVGPNGSGKSNIMDAVLWVLGEQSYKNIRAKLFDIWNVEFPIEEFLIPPSLYAFIVRIKNPM